MRVCAEKQDSGLMRAMFGAIAPRYDFVTNVFSYGMDRRWKRLAVNRARMPESAIVLDLASGTGDFSQLVREHAPRARTVAVDLTEHMLQLARQRGVKEALCGNALGLPFRDAAFDCVFVGYGLRNFPSLRAALEEIRRVMRPGGMLVSLDFFLPANAFLRWLYLGYLYAQGAFWGLLLHRRARLYTYIPDSLQQFISIEEYSALLRAAAFVPLDEQSHIFGGIGLHWAIRGD